jgi:hypothetical protein
MKRLFTLFTLIACCWLSNCSVATFAQNTSEITLGNCKACVSACQKTLDYCTQKGGKYGQETITNALKDCITACKFSGEYLARGSNLGKKSATLCIEACNNCAKSCESFKDDNNMKACADECRKCAGNCQKVATGAL